MRATRSIECSLRASFCLASKSCLSFLYFSKTLFSGRMYLANFLTKNWEASGGGGKHFPTSDKFFGQKVSTKLFGCSILAGRPSHNRTEPIPYHAMPSHPIQVIEPSGYVKISILLTGQAHFIKRSDFNKL